MKKGPVIGLAITFCASFGVPAQSNSAQPSPTPARVVVKDNLPAPAKITAPLPKPSPTTVVPNASAPPQTGPEINFDMSRKPVTSLTFSQIKGRIAEAKRLLQSRPQTISSDDPKIANNWVRIAFLDPKTQKVEFATVAKDALLKTGAVNRSIATDGRQVITKTIRANGVNTPISVFDEAGNPQLPLLVQYPVEKGGRYIETAYYMSTHPGLVTNEVVNAGRLYVRNTIEIARERLNGRGISIDPKIADIAERLATVEHVDHDRFRKEPHLNIYNDVFTLYALNEGQTYRYSVSSAGAGGMVQMIPSTYSMVRSRFSQVNLIPDFVEGMRNHVNAAQAMLLYMQMTWNDLAASPTVSGALTTGIASQKQLMAAGYNSNPAKLPGYINRGGADWATLIPRETKIYLQIYDSLENFVPMTPRPR